MHVTMKASVKKRMIFLVCKVVELDIVKLKKDAGSNLNLFY